MLAPLARNARRKAKKLALANLPHSRSYAGPPNNHNDTHKNNNKTNTSTNNNNNNVNKNVQTNNRNPPPQGKGKQAPQPVHKVQSKANEEEVILPHRPIDTLQQKEEESHVHPAVKSNLPGHERFEVHKFTKEGKPFFVVAPVGVLPASFLRGPFVHEQILAGNLSEQIFEELVEHAKKVVEAQGEMGMKIQHEILNHSLLHGTAPTLPNHSEMANLVHKQASEFLNSHANIAKNAAEMINRSPVTKVAEIQKEVIKGAQTVQAKVHQAQNIQKPIPNQHAPQHPTAQLNKGNQAKNIQNTVHNYLSNAQQHLIPVHPAAGIIRGNFVHPLLQPPTLHAK